jgi:hypothetical protein
MQMPRQRKKRHRLRTTTRGSQEAQEGKLPAPPAMASVAPNLSEPGEAPLSLAEQAIAIFTTWDQSAVNEVVVVRPDAGATPADVYLVHLLTDRGVLSAEKSPRADWRD